MEDDYEDGGCEALHHVTRPHQFVFQTPAAMLTSALRRQIPAQSHTHCRLQPSAYLDNAHIYAVAAARRYSFNLTVSRSSTVDLPLKYSFLMQPFGNFQAQADYHLYILIFSLALSRYQIQIQILIEIAKKYTDIEGTFHSVQLYRRAESVGLYRHSSVLDYLLCMPAREQYVIEGADTSERSDTSQARQIPGDDGLCISILVSPYS